VALWDGRTANLPRPPARKFIAPARKEVAKVHQSVLAEPTLELPNLEQNIADLNFSAVRLTDVPLLPKPPSSTSPIRIVNSSQSGQIPQSATADSAQHEPANIISIPDMPIPAAKVLLIPALNQVASALIYGAGGQGNGLGGSPGDTGSGSEGPGSNGNAADSGTGGGRGGSASKASDGAGATSAGVAGPGHGAGNGVS